ncbi:hypothetical protein QAD02_011863 [Eretmocerus hayati]|uniref:Uncharacterized protein n=1 Tax=Eretmocerus hayati TaxID=131215 RepID=A0ACC2P0V5_9HYME|nr:hypothetical protein QAD02_011863 [Eretmocerus hayati]
MVQYASKNTFRIDLRRRLEERQPAGAAAIGESELDVAVALLSLGDATRDQTQRIIDMQQQTQNALLADRRPTFSAPNVQTGIRDFHGIEGQEKADAWVRELEIMQNVNSWNDVVAFNVAKAHLKNAAMKWYMTNVDSITSYAEFIEKF